MLKKMVHSAIPLERKLHMTIIYDTGIHYCVNMVLIAVSTILSVMIINLGQPSNSKPPKWLLKVSYVIPHFILEKKVNVN